MSRVIYFADPMCSWCYGFGPQLSSLLAGDPSLDLLLVVGGLRPYNTKVADAKFKDMLRGHWQHVRTLSGLPISETILQRDDFVYDTEPACRAVVTFRARKQEGTLRYFDAVQAAFYRDGQDVTEGDILADLACDHGFEREVFLAAWQSDAAREATRVDFETTQRLGVTGFPTLALEHETQLYALASGFASSEDMASNIERVRARAGSGAT